MQVRKTCRSESSQPMFQKNLVIGPNGDMITLPTVGFKPTTYWTQKHIPNPWSTHCTIARTTPKTEKNIVLHWKAYSHKCCDKIRAMLTLPPLLVLCLYWCRLYLQLLLWPFGWKQVLSTNNLRLITTYNKISSKASSHLHSCAFLVYLKYFINTVTGSYSRLCLSGNPHRAVRQVWEDDPSVTSCIMLAWHSKW